MTSFFTHFDSGSLPAALTAITAGSGSVTVDTANSELLFTLTANGDAAAVYLTDPIDPTVNKLVRMVVRHSSATTPDFRLFLLPSASAPAPNTLATLSGACQIRLATATTGGKRHYALDKFDTGGTRTQWNRSTNAWASPTVSFLGPITAGDYHEFVFEVNGTTQAVRLLARGGHDSAVSSYTATTGYKWHAISDWVLFSDLRASGGNPYYLVFGFPLTDNGAAATVAIETLEISEGTKDYFLYNGRDSGSAYQLYLGHRLGDATRGVPSKRTTWLGVTGATTENTALQWQTVLRDDDDVYVAYYRGLGSTGAGIHAVTFTDFEGTITREGMMVDVTDGPSLTLVSYPFIVKDGREADAAKRYKLLFSGISSVDSKYRIYMATAADRLGPWTVDAAPVLEPGTSGAWDDEFAAAPVVLWETDHWELWYGGNGAGTSGAWGVGRATGATLEPGAFTKDGANPMIATQEDQIEALTANLSGRTASVASTTGFVADQLVVIDQDATVANNNVSRVRRVVTNTSVELYHGLMGFTTANAAHIFGYRAGSATPAGVQYRNGRWEIVCAVFGSTSQHGSIAAFMESSVLYTTADLSVAPTISWTDSDTVGHYAGGAGTTTHSAENLAFVQVPVAAPSLDATATVTGHEVVLALGSVDASTPAVYVPIDDWSDYRLPLVLPPRPVHAVAWGPGHDLALAVGAVRAHGTAVAAAPGHAVALCEPDLPPARGVHNLPDDVLIALLLTA